MARRGQPDVGKGLSGDLSPGEPGLARDAPRAPQVADFEIDLEAFEPVCTERHPIARRDDRDRLPAARRGGADFRLERAAHLCQHDWREIVEIGRAEFELAGRQLIGADGDMARKLRRREAQREIVDAPAAIGGFRHMGRALQLVPVDVARGRGGRLDRTGNMGRLSLEGDARRPAVEQTALAQSGLQRGAEIVGNARQPRGDLGFARYAGIEDAGLRDVDAGVEVHLVAAEIAVEPGLPMRSAGGEVGETEASARRRARGAVEAEVAAGQAVEHRIGGGQVRRMRVDRRGERAIARRAIEIGGKMRFALEGAAGERRETAEVLRRDFEPAMHLFRREQA